MRLLVVSALAAACLSIPSALAAKRQVTIDDVVTPPTSLAGRAIPAVTWSPDGKRLTVREHNTLSLWELKSGKSREILPMARLEAAAVKLAVPLAFEWTNRNVSEPGVQWFPDNRHLLVAAGGDLFEVDAEKGTFQALTQTAEPERDARVSPDGKLVAFRRGHDLSLMDRASRTIRSLTSGGSPTLLNGEADWVYPEELGLETAYWWSPDSQFIAFLQFDTSREPLFPQIALLGTHGLSEPERYPKAGDPNADVRVGVVPVAGGSVHWMDLGDPRDNLISRVVWSPDSRGLLVQKLNRVQNRLDLLLANIDTGKARVVLHEEDSRWLNSNSAPVFVDSERFLFLSERSGFFHLYLYGIDGKLRRQLTSGEWEVDRLVGAGEGKAFFTSTEVSPLERHLYSIDLDGSNKRQLTAGEGTHAVCLAPSKDAFLDDYSGLTAPPRSTVYRADGSELRVLRAPEDTSELDLLPARLLKFTTRDGADLYARLIQPAGFQPGARYPAIVVVYGGPGAQQIHNVWAGVSWEQVLAHRGFVVWQVDNRGSTGRGHAFELPIYHNLGRQELADQREGIDWLIARGSVDSSRIGMYGWSYGGFMTLYTATHAPGLLKAAVAGAPVTDWRNYDSIYTERYMGLPAEDPDAYRTTSVQSTAAALEGTRLLMIHNAEDDNVHFQNTIQMANALELANKQFYMLVYPGKTHGVDGAPRRHLLEEATSFFEASLK